MVKTTIQIMKIELHDTRSNHKWFFMIDALKPEIKVFKNGVPKATLPVLISPISTQNLMCLTEDL